VDKIDAAQFSPEQLSVEDRVVLEDAMSQLRDLEKEVLSMFHFDALSQTEIAGKLDISCNYVSHILRQSLSKLRKILASEERKDRILRTSDVQSENDIIDSNSGAYTETYLRCRLEEELHRASFDNTLVAVVIVKFTGLEGLRKFYGEQSILDFLSDAADFFKENLRRLDVVGRYGDNGFAIVLPSGGKNVQLVKDRLFASLQDWVSGRYGTTGAVQIMVGNAVSPEHGKNSHDILSQATATLTSPASRAA
jgi:RNA polymerase sigma-B factor